LNLYRTPFILPLLYPTLTWRMPGQEKVIYLTFDDGPVPGPTEFVLNVLEKNKALATFFCIGDNVLRNPTVFKKIKESHHAVGNHTFNHLKGWNNSTKDYVANTAKCAEVIGEENDLFRPPYGRIKRSQIRRLPNYRIVMWDVLTHDYLASLSQEKCLRGSIAATRPGSIVVFHDSYKAERNMTYALPRYIDHFLNQGYVFKSMPAHGS
jgi:peptidoglycan/xylan/chitin deacetylase (PgdA/CDA1 family)